MARLQSPVVLWGESNTNLGVTVKVLGEVIERV